MSKAKRFKELVKKKAQQDEGRQSTKDEWVSDIANLFETVSVWLQEEDIEYRAQTSDFVDAKIGKYHSVILVITHGDYDATIGPEYSPPCVVVRSGKKSGENAMVLVRDKSEGTARWKVPINPSSKVGKELTKDRFFDLLISLFKLEDE